MREIMVSVLEFHAFVIIIAAKCVVHDELYLMG